MRPILNLPMRTPKPRERGITHVLDKGLGLRQIEDLLETASGLIDIVKFGWGTGYVTQNLEAKIAVYREAGVPTCFGGTLLELAILQGRFDEFRRELRRLGMTHAELSTGVIDLTPEERFDYIRALARDFVVLSEVGSKDAQRIIPPYLWVEQTEADLAAGSWRVICEARESGTVGIYHTSGEVKAGLIEEIVHRVDPGRLVFEAVYAQGKLDEYKRWLGELGMTHVEISDGVIDLPRERKLELIADFARDFVVLSEVGSKDSDVVYAPYQWVAWIKEERDAGAWKVITEGREGGTAGIFRKDGDMRTGLIDEIAHEIAISDLIFEAPTKSSQAWFVKHFGPNVNLGNIPPDEVIPLETLRLGLRGDTLKEMLLGSEPAPAR